MKRIMILTTASLIALSGTVAVANTNLELQVERYVGDVDLSALTAEQQLELQTVISGGGTFSERRAVVKALLADTGALLEDRAIMIPVETNYDGLEAAIQRYEPTFRVEMVNDETLLALQNVLYSGETEQEKRILIGDLIKS